ncbi:hypothetical protein C5Z26_05605 [Lactobacillus sp. CBA3606]|uniref:hypothetical protein n=1 Tax=unclassified Lactobacillus TaxID=2620435 RepID=UPI000CFDB18F|nr:MULTISPECIES: hypothetical protein [unclassified Lactobacillus]AVK61016.1 hypothetical protein C5Z25_04240 [Lactobacillus sp. CBA3605]AVK63612.1 hypothetical protein C5Z26_05605 [Lactobacillus sp. CBA3606]
MIASLIYWVVVVGLIVWGVWMAILSAYWARHQQNGNLFFIAIMNTLGLLAGLLVWWVFNHQNWQYYWLSSTVNTSNLLGLILICYVVLIVIEFIQGRGIKPEKA